MATVCKVICFLCAFVRAGRGLEEEPTAQKNGQCNRFNMTVHNWFSHPASALVLNRSRTLLIFDASAYGVNVAIEMSVFLPSVNVNVSVNADTWCE